MFETHPDFYITREEYRELKTKDGFLISRLFGKELLYSERETIQVNLILDMIGFYSLNFIETFLEDFYYVETNLSNKTISDKTLNIYIERTKAIDKINLYLRAKVFPYVGLYKSISFANKNWNLHINFIKDKVFKECSPKYRLYVIWWVNSYYKI